MLLSEETSTRAISFDSVTRTPAPFPPDSPVRWGADGRTRVEVFAMNLALQPNEDARAVTAEAEDASGKRYVLKVEFVGLVPGFEWMTAVVLRLDDDLADVGDVLVSVAYRGTASNRVRLGIGHIGGGPPDDAGARPTPPRLISGRVASNGAGIGGVKILVSGSKTLTLTTEADGTYSFIAAPLADYTLAPQLTFFDFDPPTKTFTGLDDNQTDVDFDAVRQTHAVSGQVQDDNGRELRSFGVRLEGGEGFVPRTANTDDGGKFSFPGVPAGYSYTVTPLRDDIFTFTPEKVELLAGDVSLSIRGTRRRYAIGGRVWDYAGGVAGVKVELNGQGLATTTDEAGRFRFEGLGAGLPYRVNVSNSDYAFDVQGQTIDSLGGDADLSFHATPQFVLSGRVTDAAGNGVFSINVVITGPQNGSIVTRADGVFSFTVNFYGDYTLTFAKEQGYYTFDPPSQRLTGVKSSRTANFTSTLTKTFSPSHVLEFDGTPKTVDFGLFWDEGKVLGHFFWEAWAMPGPNTSGGYMISDGYGGAHAILFGFGFLDGSEPNHYQLIGNTWDGAHVVSFASDEGPQPGEWGHCAVGWDGQYLITYFDGVPVGRNKFTGQRKPGGASNGAGHLLIGGSDHSNFQGRIAQISGYEGANPREGDGTDKSLPYAPFAPKTLFDLDSNFLNYSFRPGDPLTDLSRGFGGLLHRGFRRGVLNGYLFGCDGCPLPVFVVDSTAPDFSNPNNPGQTPAPAPQPASVPAGALVFDSFSRRNSTYILGGTGGLGSTEGGSAGGRAWQTNAARSTLQPFGILNGRAVLLANKTSVAWVDAGATNLDIRIERKPRAFGAGHNTGVSFRVADASNYFFAYTSEGVEQSDPKKLTVGYYFNGVRTDLATGINMPNNPQSAWTTLRVLTYADGRIQVFADATPVFSTTSNVLSNATGAGLYNNSAGLGLTNRWENFLVLPIQN